MLGWSCVYYYVLCNSAKGLVPSHEVSSDPIQPFSSPSAFDQDYEVSVGQESPPEPKAPQVSWNGDDDDDEMPSVRKLGQRAQQLAELKRRALQHQSIPGSEDDDDELMIVSVRREGSQEDRRRKSDTIGIGIAGGAIGSRSMAKVGIMGPLHKGKDGLGSARESKRNSTTLQTLNDQLWQKVEEAQRREVARKEDEWENRGGRLKERDQGGKTQDALRLYAEKAKQNIDGAVTLAHDESDDGDDEDWAPRDDSSPYASIGRRSASLLSGPGSDSDGEDAASQATDVDDADDKENSLPRLRVPNRRVRRAVDSDDEDENYPTSRGRVLVPDTSLIIPFDASPGRSLTHRISHSSFETDNDEEKENEKARMWDKSEDKENKAVVRHDPFARTSRGFYPGILGDSSRSGIGIHRDQSASPGIPDSDDEPQSGDRGNRTPFKDLLKDRGDVSLSLGPDFAPSFIQRLTQPQPNLDACGSRLSTPSPKLKPLLNKTDPEELDREVQEDENAFALWKPALGSLFEDGTQLPSASGSHLMKDAEVGSSILREDSFIDSSLVLVLRISVEAASQFES
jgi:mediator of replication checkpoint protein 1